MSFRPCCQFLCFRLLWILLFVCVETLDKILRKKILEEDQQLNCHMGVKNFFKYEKTALILQKKRCGAQIKKVS